MYSAEDEAGRFLTSHDAQSPSLSNKYPAAPLDLHVFGERLCGICERGAGNCRKGGRGGYPRAVR